MRIAALLLSFVFSASAWACKCAETEEAQEYDDAEAVLLVRVVSSEWVPSVDKARFDAVHAKFDVIETYKGSVGNLRYLKSEKVTCEVPLIPGDQYLIYSYGGEYEVLNRCTHSRWINPVRDKALLNEYSRRK